jgi:serine/threonine-protein kinase RsbW
MRYKLTLSIDSDLELVGLLTKAVRALCEDVLSEEETDAVELSVDEAVTNVIRHGYANKNDQRLDVELSFGDREVVIDILDHAEPMQAEFDEADASVFDFDQGDPSTLPESGMGIALIKRNMDSVEYTRGAGRNRLRMVKFFSKPNASTPAP